MAGSLIEQVHWDRCCDGTNDHMGKLAIEPYAFLVLRRKSAACKAFPETDRSLRMSILEGRSLHQQTPSFSAFRISGSGGF